MPYLLYHSPPLQDVFDFDARVQVGINYGRLNGDIVSGDQVVVVHSDRGVFGHLLLSQSLGLRIVGKWVMAGAQVAFQM